MSGQEQTQEDSHECQHSYGTPHGYIYETKGTGEPQPNSEVSSPKKFQPIHFLVADDNRVNQKIITKLLTTKLGHGLDLVVNGEEAVEAYKKGHQTYQCILLDTSMPVMSGIGAMKLIRAFEEENSLNPACIVALTAGERVEEDRVRMQNFGFTTAIRKPLCFSVKALNKFLEEMGLLREA